MPHPEGFSDPGIAAPVPPLAVDRSPRCPLPRLILSFALQVHDDFEFMGKAANLTTLCVYGGAPYGPQESALRRGVDVVVGTPGRIKDFLEKGTLKLDNIKYRVLDECDEMLNMGFAEDVEKIMSAIPDPTQVSPPAAPDSLVRH